MKKLFAVLVALTLVLSMGTIALAADDTTPTGSITITNAAKDAEYDFYRIFDLASYDAEKNTYSYKLSQKWADAGFKADDYFKTNENGYVEWTADDTDNGAAVNAFVKDALAFAETKSLSPDADAKATEDGALTIDTLPLGYYLIDTSLGTLCSITTTNPNAEITEKNAKPDIDKEVLEDRNNTWGEVNDSNIDQIIEYKATITVGLGATNYVMHDTMEKGITFNYNPVADDKNDNDVVVKLDDGTVVNSSNYTVTVSPTDGHTFDVKFEDSFIESLAQGDKIEVYYYAYLNEDAKIAYDGGNINEVYLTYGEEHTWETGKHYTSTYTWKIDVLKFAETDENPEFPLAGAKFKLLDAEGNVLTFTKDGNTYKIDAAGTLNEIETDATGKFEIIGLDEGEYKLRETKAPDGYNELANDIEVTVESTITDQSKYETTVTYTFTPAEDNVVKVENKTGTLLPETGGIGTTIFYIVGITLMFGAAIVLISKKRMASFA